MSADPVSLGVLLPSAARAQGNPDWHRRIPGLYVAEREQAFEKELAKQTADAHAGNTVGFEIGCGSRICARPS